ncbi:MAG: hypothetical protein CL678_02685 [Bdellovibrionaceae bacterium]|nr:hypothetical protein [Pseudobdellovibrionaceae bacterium]|tara:strand:+ start:3346 stop:3789 length:444 start_codon:yes stop_codon:yes gene_type:complete
MKTLLILILSLCGASYSWSEEKIRIQELPTNLPLMLPEGGEIPIPHARINKRMELAPGEFYELHGRIESIAGIYYFEVDLMKHPWLAVSYRNERPFYLIENPENFHIASWTQAGTQVLVRANGKLINDQYHIFLEIVRPCTPSLFGK